MLLNYEYLIIAFGVGIGLGSCLTLCITRYCC